MAVTNKKKLKPGEVRKNIKLPDMYGHKVTIDGKRVVFTPTVEVTVYKDKWGRYAVTEKGHRLTAQEKRMGYKRSRGKEARFIKQEFEKYGPESSLRKMTQLKGKSSKSFPKWEVNAVKGWVNLSKVGKKKSDGVSTVDPFIGEHMIGRMGDMERLMYSLDRTTYGVEAGLNFRKIWNSLTETEKFAKMVELEKIDWDDFFNEYVDSDGENFMNVDTVKQEIGLTMILEILTK